MLLKLIFIKNLLLSPYLKNNTTYSWLARGIISTSVLLVLITVGSLSHYLTSSYGSGLALSLFAGFISAWLLRISLETILSSNLKLILKIMFHIVSLLIILCLNAGSFIVSWNQSDSQFKYFALTVAILYMSELIIWESITAIFSVVMIKSQK